MGRCPVGRAEVPLWDCRRCSVAWGWMGAGAGCFIGRAEVPRAWDGAGVGAGVGMGGGFFTA